jgi:hypothetical protein
VIRGIKSNRPEGSLCSTVSHTVEPEGIEYRPLIPVNSSFTYICSKTENSLDAKTGVALTGRANLNSGYRL